MEAVANLACTLGIYRTVRLLRNRLVRPDLRRRAGRWRQFYS